MISKCINCGNISEVELGIGICKKCHNKKVKMKKSLRYKILLRDNFTCKICGGKPPNSILHIDHINPQKNGINNNENNLRVLCSECNLGRIDYPNEKNEAINLGNFDKFDDFSDKYTKFVYNSKNLYRLKQLKKYGNGIVIHFTKEECDLNNFKVGTIVDINITSIEENDK